MRRNLNFVLIVAILLITLTIALQFNSNDEIIKTTEVNSKSVLGITGNVVNEYNSGNSFFRNLLDSVRKIFRLTGNVVYVSGSTVSMSNVFPISDINVSKDAFFNYTVNVTCNTSDCGDINVSLNVPGGGVVAVTNGDFETGDKTGWTGTPDTDFTIDPTIVKSGSYSGKLNAYESGCVNGVTTYIEQNITLSGAGTLKFTYNYSGSLNGGFCDAAYGTANCNGSSASADFLISDTSSTWSEKNYSLTSGSHTLTWFSYSWCFVESNLYVDDICMIDVSGSCIVPVDSTISTTTGDTPLYTNSTTNPKTINLAAGQSQLVTFFVNATGVLDSINEVFSVANITSNMSVGSEGTHYNLTIIEGTDIIPPTFTDIANITINLNQSLSYNINATDLSGISAFSINDTTNFKINSISGVLENNTVLSLGTYYLNVSVNDTVGNVNSEIISVSVVSLGTVSVKWITPTGNLNLTKDKFSLMQFNVSCLTGNCGTVNVTLDPLPDSNATIMALNPFRWWANGGNNDTSGNAGNPSAIIGSPTLVTSQIPNPSVNQMYYYDGNDEYDYANDANINIFTAPAGDYFAMSLWFNASVINDTGNGQIIWEQGGATNSLAIYVTDDLGSDRVFCSAVESANIDYVSTPVSVDELYHLACVYDFTGGTIKMYLNGNLVDTDSNLAIGSDLAAHSGGIGLAGENGGVDDHNGAAMIGSFIGYIGEFAYWGVSDDGALSETNISAIYYNGITSFSKPGIVPTGSGVPFYTNATTNPLTTSSLSAGQSEIIDFWVNSTGNIGGTYEFFTYVNLTSNPSIFNTTNHYNMTIYAGPDEIFPNFTVIENITSQLSLSIYNKIEATDNVAINKFSINDTINFKINSTSGVLENNTVLSLGTYYLNVSVNDTSSNLISKIIWINIIEDSILIDDDKYTISQIYQTGINDNAQTEISLNFDSETVVHSNFSHPSNSNLTFNENGTYKISYGCLFRELGTSNRLVVETWLELDNNYVNPSETHCYIRQTGDDGDRCQNSATLIMNATVGENLDLKSKKVSTGTGTNPTSEESCWISAEKVINPVAQIYETTNNDIQLTSTPQSLDFGATTYEDSGNFTVDLTNNWIEVDQNGWYKIYSVANYMKMAGTSDSERHNPSTFVYLDGTTKYIPSQSYAYTKRVGQVNWSTTSSVTIANLVAGQTIGLQGYDLVGDALNKPSTREETWLLVERIPNDNILFLYDSLGGQATSGVGDPNIFDTNVTWDKEIIDGVNYSHAENSEYFSINTYGWYEISYQIGWDDEGDGDRFIGCGQVMKNGVAIDPSKQCDYTRGTPEARYGSVSATFIVNNTVGDKYVVQWGGDDHAESLEPDSSWVIVTPISTVKTESLPQQDTTPPILTDLINLTTYSNSSLSHVFNATDDVAIDTFTVNDSNFLISSSGVLTNATILSAGKHYLNITVNDTSGNIDSGIIYIDAVILGTLNVTLISPISSMANQPQNNFFNATFNVSCTGSVGATCGGVGGRIRYNLSTISPDTNMPSGSGSPFYTIETNLLDCGTINVGDNDCSLIWQVNATGNIDSQYKIDANFVSTLIQSANTNDFGIKIISSVVSISLSNDLFNVNFGNGLTPGTVNNPAVNNTVESYNITCSNSAGNCNVTIKGNSNLNDGINNIGIGNISWNQINNNSNKNSLKLIDDIINSSLFDLATQKLFFWLDLPSESYAGNYKTNFTISAQSN